ncbi:DUF2624 family protein [Amphibacillus sediminis]|uniref:DUF2624 family protein n=1 Tax=Amphibacillus sediminis TaxID=360185 RepID=UPI00082E9ECD|nr:DUF2624 family protein [Amphibacillus sediminis]
MNLVLKQLVRNKLQQITALELKSYANEYNVPLTDHQAQQIVNILRQQNYDPFNKEDLAIKFQQLASITDQVTADKAKAILDQFIQQYGVAEWFK